jgi:hypothetical protein
MVSSTISRLIFFGGRYASLLFVAKILGPDGTGFLLAIAIVEFFRIFFDYGLENSVLARFHQQMGEEATGFLRNKGLFRLLATLSGQVVTTGVVALLCLKNDAPIALPLIASLQFTCLMGFGYFQAHLQTDHAGGMAALIRPLAFAVLMQGVLLILAYHEIVPIWLCTIFFETMALLACARVARRFRRQSASLAATSSAFSSGFDRAALRNVLIRIAPLGNVALIGIAYTRFDALAVSWVTGGALLAQYLIYQRLASAPLMFFSTVASVNIARLSEARASMKELSKKLIHFRGLAYMAGAASGAALAAISPWVTSFFQLKEISSTLLGLQCLVLAIQISNGFHAAFMIALHESLQLWSVARNNTLLAVVLIPLGAWRLEAVGIALALCMVELFCAVQYVRIFRLRTC